MSEARNETRYEIGPAPLGPRTLAALVDLAISSSLAMVALVILTAAIGALFILVGLGDSISEFKEGRVQLPALVFLIFGILVVVFGVAAVMHGYYIYYETKTGATLGKRILGLRVVTLDGHPITRQQAITRDLVRWYVDGLFIFPALLSILVTKKRQRIGDLAAGTLVISKAGQGVGEKFVYISKEHYEILYARLAPKSIEPVHRRQYLAFAYRAYIQDSKAELQPDYGKWLLFARRHLNGSELLGLNDNTVLRFFAEFCFQTHHHA